MQMPFYYRWGGGGLWYTQTPGNMIVPSLGMCLGTELDNSDVNIYMYNVHT